MKNNQISYWWQSNSLKKVAFIIHVFIQFLSACLVYFQKRKLPIIIKKNIVIFWDKQTEQ